MEAAMKVGRQFWLLPVCGAISAMMSFICANPFVGSLLNRNLSPNDPAAQFTYGTLWGNVNRAVFGALLCGSFCFVLVKARSGVRIACLRGLLGIAVGIVAGFVGDGGADLIGISLTRINRSFLAASPAVWSLLVPTIYAFAITAAMGPTPLRLKRAGVAAVAGMVASFLARILADVVAVPLLLLFGGSNLGGGDPNSMAVSVSLPVWTMEAVAVGIVLGWVIASAETRVRDGSLRLILGRNEGKEWNLDHRISRIGSMEGAEIPMVGIAGVEPLHAQITHEPQGFALHSLASTGTRLNGVPVAQAWLKPGDVIGLGSANVVFSGKEARNPIPAYPTESGSWIAGPQVQTQPVSNPLPPRHWLLLPSGQAFALQEGRNLMGREPSCTIPLTTDRLVSRSHGEIVVYGRVAQIRDLQSRNGTLLNQMTLRQVAILKDGDQVKIGSTLLLYRVEGTSP